MACGASVPRLRAAPPWTGVNHVTNSDADASPYLAVGDAGAPVASSSIGGGAFARKMVVERHHAR